MKLNFSFFALCFCFLIGCNQQPNTEIYELAKQSEKVQVVFNNRPDKYIEITSRKEIRKFDDYISTEDTPVFHCFYDGFIVFFSNGGSVRMEFNLEEGCRHIAYNYGENVVTKKITDEGYAFLMEMKPE